MTSGLDTAPAGLGTKVAAGAAGLVLLVAALAAGAGAGIASLLGVGATAPSATATAQIPAAMLALYQQAATTCPGLPWSVLAAIGTVESGNGTSTLPGVKSGQNAAGAMGPLQMLGPTFAEYDTPVPPGGANPPSPYDPTDAAYAAARMLCANGAANGANLSASVYAYNHSQSYVTQVLSLANSYSQTQAQTVAAGTAGGIAVDWALAQVGTPYRWGGETPRVGFDCSGLTQAAYAAAGIAIPRTSEAQWSALPHVPLDQIQPGDLVFFNPGEFIAGLPGHVGIYIGNNQFVDAPHTGATVRVENLASWPQPFGAARPAAVANGSTS
ncbi:MAG: NlpC/P60 family protein [Actinomycetota bacterium]|nr:NlpC/P60 family protein [Actinomycetota bacterium]